MKQVESKLGTVQAEMECIETSVLKKAEVTIP